MIRQLYKTIDVRIPIRTIRTRFIPRLPRSKMEQFNEKLEAQSIGFQLLTGWNVFWSGFRLTPWGCFGFGIAGLVYWVILVEMFRYTLNYFR